MTPITNTSEALQWCDVVVLAVPASQLVALCGTYGEVIGTKVRVCFHLPQRIFTIFAKDGSRLHF